MICTIGGLSQVMAQGSTTSGMRGVIRTDMGEALPGATVVAVHQPTGTQYGTTTNADGIFNIRNMNVGGPYKLTVSFVGYENFEKTGLYLKLGQILKADVNLREETNELDAITITARKDDVFDGNRTGAQTNISEEQINALPTASRDLSDFVRSTPQAFIDNSDDDGPAVSINGQNTRFNSIFIDGAVNNDVFGLAAQGTNGGQTGVAPISIDAIEQFEILISPYDVTQGGFTGGGINIVTRSGTNEFQGSAYYFFRNEGTAGRTPTFEEDAEREKLPDFRNRTYGARIGGPIIKDKLFFFVSAEIQRDETPAPAFGDYEGDSENRVGELQNFLSTNFGYETGGFDNNASSLESEKVLVKLDYNISQNHKLTARYSYVNAENVDGFVSNNANIRFENNSEVFPSTTHSAALEWKSSYGNNFANKLIIGYTRVEDDRGFNGNPFPFVSIRDGDGNISFGPEQFSTANLLEQDIFTITNNFNIFAGKHTITIGTHNEFYSIGNLFIARNFGAYEYNSLDDFFQHANDALTNTPTAVELRRFRRGFSLVDDIAGDGTSAIAAFDAFQLGFYIQDEFQVSDRLKLTGGFRFDIPVITTSPNFVTTQLGEGGTLDQISQFYELNGATVGESPDPQLYFAPRFGLNWDVLGDQSLQIRGGLGIFTGRVPFVWPGGIFNNNGTNVGFVDTRLEGNTLLNGQNVPFVADPQQGLTVADFTGNNPIPSGRLELFQNDFRYPQLFKVSLGVDKQLPWGMVLTVDGIFTKVINGIDVFNANLRPLNARTTEFGNGGAYPFRNYPDGVRIDPQYSAVHILRNTNRGYGYNFSAQLQKPFDNGFTFSVAYNYGDNFVINDGTSSQINSIWAFNEHRNDANNLPLSRSDFSPGHRGIISASYRKEYAKYFASQLSIFYVAAQGRPFSYTVDNSDAIFATGEGDNGLFFIPETQGDILLVENGGQSPDEQWARLNRYIESDPYLRERRGQFAERNGRRYPFEHIVDLRFLQDIMVDVGGKKNVLQLSIDIFNFTALLNKRWGRRFNEGFSAIEIVEFEGFRDADNGDFTPTYSVRLPNSERTLKNTFDRDIQDFGINSSRWQMQIGLRYIFN